MRVLSLSFFLVNFLRYFSWIEWNIKDVTMCVAVQTAVGYGLHLTFLITMR